jgi:hypothetical protein
MATTVNEKIVRRISVSTFSMIWLLFSATPAHNSRSRG